MKKRPSGQTKSTSVELNCYLNMVIQVIFLILISFQCSEWLFAFSSISGLREQYKFSFDNGWEFNCNKGLHTAQLLGGFFKLKLRRPISLEIELACHK
jgi:hypothetical protein